MQRARLLPAYLEIMLAVGDLENVHSACQELQALAEAFDTDILRAVAEQAHGAFALGHGDPRAAIGPLRRAFELWERRLAGLVLVDALGLTEFRPTPEFGAALTDYLSAPGVLTHDRLWNQCILDLTTLRTRMGDQLDLIKAYNLDRVEARERLAALRSLMEQFGAPAISLDILARIAVPTTLIWGRHDRATPLSVAEEASKRFRWNLHVINGAADDPALEQPEAFTTALRAALGESKTRGARL